MFPGRAGRQPDSCVHPAAAPHGPDALWAQATEPAPSSARVMTAGYGGAARHGRRDRGRSTPPDAGIARTGRWSLRMWSPSMRILMLGWEFPPFISGGLGTACYGLTRALDRLGHDVGFVLPKSVDQETASHVTLVSPSAGSTLSLGSAGGNGRPVRAGVAGIGAGGAVAALGAHYTVPGFSSHVQFMGVPATRRSPYPGGESGVV